MWPPSDTCASRSPTASDAFELARDDYVLRFRPQAAVDGRWFAFVIVYRDLDSRRSLGLRTIAALMPDLASFATLQEAADAGRDAGLQWVAQRQRLLEARSGRHAMGA